MRITKRQRAILERAAEGFSLIVRPPVDTLKAMAWFIEPDGQPGYIDYETVRQLQHLDFFTPRYIKGVEYHYQLNQQRRLP